MTSIKTEHEHVTALYILSCYCALNKENKYIIVKKCFLKWLYSSLNNMFNLKVNI